MKELEAIKKRAERATPGPWTAFEGNEADGVNCADDEQLTWDDHGGEVFKPANAEFIAHSRTDIPKLLAALEAVLNLANHEPRFRSRMYGGEYFPVNVAADEIIEAISEALA